ncbi:MAG: CPBP family intramembrane glutamic endopeptidase [Chitinophagaceae bacterium]
MSGFLKTRPAANQFLVLICVVLVSFFIVGLAGTLLLTMTSGLSLDQMKDMANMDFSKPGMIGFLRGMQLVQFVSLFLVPVMVCTWLFSNKPKEYLGLKYPSHNGYLVAGVTVMLIAIPFTSWLGELNRNIPFPSGMAGWMKDKEEEASRTINVLLTRHTVKELILNLFFIAGLAAVGEELLFRGMVQRLLIRMFKSPWAGIIVAAALFSAMHMQFYGFLPRFALGILLGLIYWYSGSLWAAMLAHFIYDGTLIVLAWFNPSMLAEENNMQLRNLALAGVISLGLAVLIIAWMKRKSSASMEKVYAEDGIPVKNHPFDFEQNTPE